MGVSAGSEGERRHDLAVRDGGEPEPAVVDVGLVADLEGADAPARQLCFRRLRPERGRSRRVRDQVQIDDQPEAQVAHERARLLKPRRGHRERPGRQRSDRGHPEAVVRGIAADAQNQRPAPSRAQQRQRLLEDRHVSLELGQAPVLGGDAEERARHRQHRSRREGHKRVRHARRRSRRGRRRRPGRRARPVFRARRRGKVRHRDRCSARGGRVWIHAEPCQVLGAGGERPQSREQHEHDTTEERRQQLAAHAAGSTWERSGRVDAVISIRAHGRLVEQRYGPPVL